MKIERDRARAWTRELCAALVLAMVSSLACTSTSSSYGLTREASNEGRRALEIDCAGALAFSPDSTLLASSDGRSLEVRKSPSGRPQEKLALRDGVDGRTGACIAFSPDGRWLASSCRGETGVKIFERGAWNERRAETFGGEIVTAIAFANDSSELAVGTSASRVELVAPAGGARRVLRKPRTGEERGEGASFLAYEPGDARILAAIGTGDVVAIDRAQGDVMWSRAAERVLAVSNDGKRMLTASRANGEARLFELGAGEPLLLCKIPDPDGNGVALNGVFAPGGAWLGVSYSRSFLGANWQSLVFLRVEPVKSAVEPVKPAVAPAPPPARAPSRSGVPPPAPAETWHAERIRTLSAGEPRRITMSPDGKLLCLCILPIAALYDVSMLLSDSDLRP